MLHGWDELSSKWESQGIKLDYDKIKLIPWILTYYIYYKDNIYDMNGNLIDIDHFCEYLVNIISNGKKKSRDEMDLKMFKVEEEEIESKISLDWSTSSIRLWYSTEFSQPYAFKQDTTSWCWTAILQSLGVYSSYNQCDFVTVFLKLKHAYLGNCCSGPSTFCCDIYNMPIS